MCYTDLRMQTGKCRIELVAGIRKNDRRAVAFLECKSMAWVNAKVVFDGLGEKQKKTLLTRFDHWIDGFNYPKYFHGWNLSEHGGRYTRCFVFKLPARGSNMRFYGFLEHPAKDQRFVLCVPAIHTWKDQWETEESDLKRIIALKNEKAVAQALKDLYKF